MLNYPVGLDVYFVWAFIYSKTCIKRPLKIDKTKLFMTNGSLMKVKSIAECSPWSILQYFWPALSDNKSWKPIFGLFQSGSFTQVLLQYVSSEGTSALLS